MEVECSTELRKRITQSKASEVEFVLKDIHSNSRQSCHCETAARETNRHEKASGTFKSLKESLPLLSDRFQLSILRANSVRSRYGDIRLITFFIRKIFLPALLCHHKFVLFKLSFFEAFSRASSILISFILSTDVSSQF